MRHLENAFRFTFKNFIITLPLLIAAAIPALVAGVGSVGFSPVGFFNQYQKMIQDIMSGSNFNYRDLFMSLYGPAMLISMTISGLLSLVLTILVQPATYGLINKNYETGSAKLNDFTACMSKYIGRFVLFLLLQLAIGIGIAIVFVILFTVAIFVTVKISAIGILLMIVFFLGMLVGLVTLYTYMSLWFTAVCVDDSDIVQGLKNSFKQVNGSFWPILGISLLVHICAVIAGSIIGAIIGLIPVIGGIASPVIAALGNFILMVYYFEVYREKTGRYFIPNPQQFNEGYPGAGGGI